MGWSGWACALWPVAAFVVLCIFHGANVRARREHSRRLP